MINLASVALAPAVLVCLCAVGGCGGSGGDGGRGSGAGGGTGGGGAGAPTTCEDIPGEPDILGQMSFDPPTAAPGDIVMLKMPVDDQAEFVTVSLSFDANVNLGGYTEPTYVVPTPGVQTLSVPIQTNPAAGADVYTPTIQLCTVDTGTCDGISGSGGVGVSYFEGIPGKDGLKHMLRVRYFTNGGPEGVSGTASCIIQPELTLQMAE